MTPENAVLNPFEDQRKQALALYEEMCSKCHHWSGFIQKAIESYDPESTTKYTKEIESLRAWKESAMSVDYDPQKVGKLLGVKLGDSIHDKIVPGIMALKEEIERLKAQPLTREEVEKMLNKAWDAGCNYGVEDERHNEFAYKMKSPDRRTAINNILKNTYEK